MSSLQRPGFLLDLTGAHEIADGIAGYIKGKRPVRAPLAPARSIKGARMESRWRVFVNTEVEPDL
jgi:hypothetical protein